jgi:HEAT repeat protein
LKPERRVEALKALRAFGVNGYGKEVAAVAGRLLEDYIAQGGSPISADHFEVRKEDETLVARKAAEVLVAIHEPAVPLLVKMLKYAKGQELVAALLLQTDFTAEDLKPSVPALVDEVCSRNSNLSLCATSVLAKRLDGLEPAIKKALKTEKQAKCVMDAAEALRIGVSSQETNKLRLAAASALDQIKHENKFAGKAVIQMLNETWVEDRGPATIPSGEKYDALGAAKAENLAWAMKLLYPKQRVPALLQAYRELPAERCRIAAALGELGSAAREALPVLAQALRDPNAELRQAAAAAIQKINAKEKKTPEQD